MKKTELELFKSQASPFLLSFSKNELPDNVDNCIKMVEQFEKKIMHAFPEHPLPKN